MTKSKSKAARTVLSCIALLASICFEAAAQGPAAAPSQSLRVQEIRCAGNDNTSCEFIREKLHLTAGDALDEEEVRNAELRLASLRNFTSAHVRLEKGAERGAVIVILQVEEADPIATEFIAGVSNRLTWKYSQLGARAAHQNLFGTGKYAELRAVAFVPLHDDPNFEARSVYLRYADPQLFDSRRWFAQASVGWAKRDSATEDGSFTHYESPLLNASVGWRFADFSYLTFGTTWRPGVEQVNGLWYGDGTFEVRDESERIENTIDIGYGWNSEDDLHFPTRGSAFQTGLIVHLRGNEGVTVGGIQFRKTWSAAGGYWSIAFGGEPINEYRESFQESQIVAFTYARSVEPGPNIRRGRWYIEPGFDFGFRTPEGDTRYGAGLKVGWRAETRQFGVVNLYILASTDWAQ
jgi:outer membrane protein assembly factor BamA